MIEYILDTTFLNLDQWKEVSLCLIFGLETKQFAYLQEWGTVVSKAFVGKSTGSCQRFSLEVDAAH